MMKEELIEGIKGVSEDITKGAGALAELIKKIAGIGAGKKTRLVIIAVLAVLVLACYFLFLFRQTCDTQDCFLNGLWKCNRVDYTTDAKDTWHYSIMGLMTNECEVKVKSIKIRSDSKIAAALEGKEMTCYLPKGSVFMPESKIEYCHGRLKEEIQDQIIRKMHIYIVQNIGEIKGIPKVV